MRDAWGAGMVARRSKARAWIRASWGAARSAMLGAGGCAGDRVRAVRRRYRRWYYRRYKRRYNGWYTHQCITTPRPGPIGQTIRLSPALRLVARGAAKPGTNPREVCVGVSPALATKLWFTMSGLPVGEVLVQIIAGIEAEGCIARVVRVPSTVDLGVIGLTAAELAGSGVAVGLQAKGTALIHRRGLAPLACLELLSIAPLLTGELYRRLGTNAARYAKGERPAPVRNPYTDQAIEARYHADVVALIAIERSESLPGAPPVDIEVQR